MQRRVGGQSVDGQLVLQQRSFADLAKQCCEGIYKRFEAVSILAGLELFKLAELDTQVSYFLLAVGLQIHCKGLFV